MTLTWRHLGGWCLLRLTLASPLAAQSGTVTNTVGDGIRVTLLGTGRPDPAIDRFGPSTLVEAGGETLLFDCGRGATQRLWQRPRTRTTYDGPLEVGEDLMVIEIGAEIRVDRAGPPKPPGR